MGIFSSRQSWISLSLSTTKLTEFFHRFHVLDLPLQTLTGDQVIRRPLNQLVIRALGSARICKLAPQCACACFDSCWHRKATSQRCLVVLACVTTASINASFLGVHPSECQKLIAKASTPPLIFTHVWAILPSFEGVDMPAPSLSNTAPRLLSIARVTPPDMCLRSLLFAFPISSLLMLCSIPKKKSKVPVYLPTYFSSVNHAEILKRIQLIVFDGLGISLLLFHLSCSLGPLVSCHVMSCHVMSCHVMSCHVMSCHVMSCHVMSCHVMSCHVMSCHVMSCHTNSSHGRKTYMWCSFKKKTKWHTLHVFDSLQNPPTPRHAFSFLLLPLSVFLFSVLLSVVPLFLFLLAFIQSFLRKPKPIVAFLCAAHPARCAPPSFFRATAHCPEPY